MVVQVLNRRLLRMVKNTWGQFLALTLIVMLGVLIYISMTTSFMNLSRSQQSFYQNNEFADYFFHVVKAPQAIMKQVENVSGVVKANGRIQKDIPFIKPDGGRGTVRLTTYNLPLEKDLNRIEVTAGRMFARESGQGIEVLVDPIFAQANSLDNGGILEIASGGRKIPLKVVGTAVGPEFVYLMKDAASFVPEPGEFGVVMISYDHAEQILDMKGQINQVLLKLAPGTSAEQVERQVEKILAPYGNLAAYPREQQLSHVALKSELEQLKVSSRFMPLIFFLVAAGIQFLLLGRMIKAQRSSIGVMKALGLSNTRIVSHFVSYAAAVSLTGSALGIVFGIYLASIFSQMYALFFNLPATIGGINYNAIGYSVFITLAVGISSGLLACRGIINIQPAEAMRAKAPAKGGSIALERWEWIWHRFNSSWKMSFRSIARNRTRFGVTVLGVAGTVVILILAFFTGDSMDYMMDRHFKMENRYDFLVTFNGPLKQSEIMHWQQWKEVEKMEPVLQVPVRVFSDGDGEALEDDDTLQGMRVGQKLAGIYSVGEKELEIPEEGVLLSERTAKKLEVQVGDWMWVESKMGMGPSYKARLKVVGINQQLMGAGSYVSLETANKLLRESNIVTALMLKIDPEKWETFTARLQDFTAISSVVSREKERNNWADLLDSAIYFIGVMVFFAGILGLAIIYNASLMNYNERKNELASLRVIGYTQREIGGLLFKETFLQAMAGIIIGLPLGRILGGLYMTSVSTDLFTMPVVIFPATYLIVTVLTIVFMLAGFWLVVPRLKQLDLVEALKNMD